MRACQGVYDLPAPGPARRGAALAPACTDTWASRPAVQRCDVTASLLLPMTPTTKRREQAPPAAGVPGCSGCGRLRPRARMQGQQAAHAPSPQRAEGRARLASRQRSARLAPGQGPGAEHAGGRRGEREPDVLPSLLQRVGAALWHNPCARRRAAWRRPALDRGLRGAPPARAVDAIIVFVCTRGKLKKLASPSPDALVLRFQQTQLMQSHALASELRRAPVLPGTCVHAAIQWVAHRPPTW